MAINLSRLNISLDKFNAESSGTYNIGQIKLSSDGKSVYRTNNHKTFTILNRTEIRSEEALAVKFAFCRALSKEGLSQEDIAAVKQKLGIPGSALDALKAGNIKPLTAAEVREVIDQYASQINQNRASLANGVKPLKTSAEIYRGVGKDEMESRATARNEINAQSFAKLKTGADNAVNKLLDILHFGGDGSSVNAEGKQLAREILTKLDNPAAFNGLTKTVAMTTSTAIKFKLQDNGKITAELTLKNGNSFSIDTGLDRAGLVDKAVTVLNAAIAATPPKAEKPRVEKKAADDIMNAINEIESGVIEEGEIEEGEVEPQGDKGGMSNENLLKGLDIVFNAVKNAKGQVEKRALRDANMEAVVKALQQALDRARHLDDRNTKLINDVREVFYGNKAIDPDKLLKDISDVLNKKRFNPDEKIAANKLNQVEEDLNETININAWLGEDDA